MKRSGIKAGSRSRLRPRSKQAVKDKELDALCRRLVVELRDQNTCQWCGSKKNIQWAHVHTRRLKSGRWLPINSLALCSGCHLRWHHFPLEGTAMLAEKFGDRLYALATLRSTPQKVDRTATKLWLESEIRRMEGR